MFVISVSYIKPIEEVEKYLAAHIDFLKKYYDTGNKVGYLKTLVDFALARDDVGPEFREYLKSLSL